MDNGGGWLGETLAAWDLTSAWVYWLGPGKRFCGLRPLFCLLLLVGHFHSGHVTKRIAFVNGYLGSLLADLSLLGTQEEATYPSSAALWRPLFLTISTFNSYDHAFK